MIRHTVAIAVVSTTLTFSSTPAAAADGASDAAAAAGSVAVAVPALAADVDWALPAVHVPQSSRGSVLPALYIGVAGLQVYDGYSTLTGFKRGAIETNAVMKNVAGNPAAMLAVKGGVTAASIFMAERLWKQNRRTAAIVTMIATNGLMAAVAARNASVLHAQQ
jgi:hypothetical protein